MIEYYIKHFGPFIAPFASLSLPGFGQYLNSQHRKALAHLLLWFVALITNLIFFSEYGYLWAIFNIYSALDAHLNDTSLVGQLGKEDPETVMRDYKEWERRQRENPPSEPEPEKPRFKRKVRGKPKFKPFDPVD